MRGRPAGHRRDPGRQTGTLKVKNPWPGQQVEVVDGTQRRTVVVAHHGRDMLNVPVRAGRSYLVEQVAAPTTALPFAPVTGTARDRRRHLGKRADRPRRGRPGRPPRPSAPCSAAPTPATASPGSTTPAPARPRRPPRPTSAGSAPAPPAARRTESDMYFDIDRPSRRHGSYDATVTVSYYDAGAGTVALQYDNGPGDPYHDGRQRRADRQRHLEDGDVHRHRRLLRRAGERGHRFPARLAAADHRAQRRRGRHRRVGSGRDRVPARARRSPRRRAATVTLASSISGTAVPDGAVTVDEGSAALCTATADGQRSLELRACRRAHPGQADHHRDGDRPDRAAGGAVGGGQLRRLGPAARHRRGRLGRGRRPTPPTA